MITATLTDPAGVQVVGSWDHDGQHSGGDLLTSLVGWVAGVGVESERVSRSSGHGDFPAPTRRTGRTLTMSVLCERDSRAELWALEREFSGLFAEGGTGTLTVDQDGSSLTTQVDLDGEPKPLTNLDAGYVSLEVPLHASDPVLYAPERVTTLHPVGVGVGLRYPLFAGGVLDFGAGVTGDEVIQNLGNTTSYPIVWVYGDFPGGWHLTAGGRSIVWPWPTALTAPVRVDMSGSIWIGPDNVTHLASVRRWVSIPKHGSLSLTLAPIQGGSGWAEVHQRDTYL